MCSLVKTCVNFYEKIIQIRMFDAYYTMLLSGNVKCKAKPSSLFLVTQNFMPFSVAEIIDSEKIRKICL